jgi:hypothetical protein
MVGVVIILFIVFLFFVFTYDGGVDARVDAHDGGVDVRADAHDGGVDVRADAHDGGAGIFSSFLVSQTLLCDHLPIQCLYHFRL